ncbi:MAG TPA: hypothetical protein VK957_16675 [Lunatimonas sp.]|nr:hypothetical protein [Lunatimonas sp.]
MVSTFKYFIAFIVVVSLHLHQLEASQIYIGAQSVDITPELPVAVTGQFHLRIATEAETPLTANILVLESRENNRMEELAVMVSCDVLYIPMDLIEELRNSVKQKLPGMDVNKIFLNATHTHTAPVLTEEGEYWIPKEGVTQVKDYRVFFVEKITEGIVSAWNNRMEGSVAWGLSYAVAGYNRRIAYSDGTSGMSSKTNLREFVNLEGSEDHDINTLFFWNKEGKLISMVIGVASPSQEVEGRHAVNADFWHPVRMGIQEKFGKEVCILGWVAAAGDLTPHLRYRKAADDRMRELRNLSRTEELARRIIIAVEESYETVKTEKQVTPIFKHHIEKLPLPERWVTERDFLDADAFVSDAKKQIASDPKASERLYRRMKWQEATVERYKKQKDNPNPVYGMELHVIRLGDIAICTNEFELFSDFGIRMIARSKALQTFVVQLTGSPGWGSYLPTAKAVHGGAYSAVIHSTLIGPEGGQVLVDRTVEVINGLWPE